MVLAMLIGQHGSGDLVVLGVTALIILAAALPLARHLWASPANSPDHLPHRSSEQDLTAATVDRFATRWGGGFAQRKEDH